MGRRIWSLPPQRWQFPEREHFFVTDVHADADALLSSLEAAGGVLRRGSDDFVLTPRGTAGVFVMGGDYLDKGPSNLRVLRVLERLIDSGADAKLLAGNHDVRTLLGIACAEASDPRLAHLFVRICPKVVPLLREMYDAYLADVPGLVLEDDGVVAARLLPDPSWWDEFPRLVQGIVPPKRIRRELRRVREKAAGLPAALRRVGMTMGMVGATLRACRAQFLEPGGDFTWLYERLQVVHRAGSFLFCHAGIDDVVARALSLGETESVNARFRELLADDPFTLYNGPLGNMFRTKYRKQDFPFTEIGAACLRSIGVLGIVHGHKSHVTGQQMSMRNGIAHFECDTSLDRNTRIKCGLPGIGRSATIIGCDSVRAISNDSAFERVLAAAPASA
jgi:hypothetical protein